MGDSSSSDSSSTSDSSSSSSSSSSSADGDDDEKMISNNNRNRIRNGYDRSNNKSTKRKIVGILVEDGSDSEYENEDYNSPWRNRRPSPGLWIEPVEQFKLA